ncbi:MAG: YncE family protein [Dehalococcoidia bacterium]
MTVLDLAAGEEIAAWPVARNPHEFAMAGATLYVSNYRSDRVTLLDRVSGATSLEQSTARRPHGLAVDSQNRVWYTTADGQIQRLGGEDPGATIAVGDTPHAIAIDPARDRAYVAVAGAGEVVAVDLAWGRVVGREKVGGGAESVALSADGSTIAVAAADARQVTVLRAESLSPLYTVRLPGRPVRVAITDDAVLASLAGRGALAIIDRASGSVRAMVALGRLPDGIAVDAEANVAYVTVTGDDIIAVVDLEQSAVVGTLPAGAGPSGLLWAPVPPQ